MVDNEATVLPEMEFCDNRYSGAELVRPALERLRDRLATYISKAQSDGAARWEIDSIQSEHVKQIFSLGR